jgi:hypothetical protein
MTEQEQNCRKLWAAVLETATIEIKKAKVKRGLEALIWIHNKKSTAFNSFIGICRILDLNPDETRQAILKCVYKKNNS